MDALVPDPSYWHRGTIPPNAIDIFHPESCSQYRSASSRRLDLISWMVIHNQMDIHFRRRRLQLRQPVRVRFFRTLSLPGRVLRAELSAAGLA